MAGGPAFFVERLLKYSRYMLCRPSRERVKEFLSRQHSMAVDTSHMHPVGLVMLWGFQLERLVKDGFVGASLRKPVRVDEFEEVLGWLFLADVAVPIPSHRFDGLFTCDVTRNIVYEVWMPRANPGLLEKTIKSAVTLVIPQTPYVLSYKEMIDSLKTIAANSEDIRVYVLSKFAQPGYLGRFIEEFGGTDIAVYIATEQPSVPSYFKKKLEKYGNVFIVPTRSHRKLVFIVFRDELGDWCVSGYRGSMNLFFPGVDDYMEAVNDLRDLQRLAHGLLRAFLIT